jgi:P4 family phage/plasmid primase-like protien
LPSPVPFVVTAFAFAGGVKDTSPRPLEIPWPSAFLDDDELLVRDVKDGPLWSPVVMRSGATRWGNDAVEAVTALCYDFDHAADPEAVVTALRPYDFLLHTTYQHRPEAPRFRVILPLAQPVPVAAFPRAWEWGAARVKASGCSPDPACKDPSRRYYWRSCPPDMEGEAFAFHAPGTLLDPAPFIRAAPAPATRTATPAAPSVFSAAAARGDKAPVKPLEQDRLPLQIEAQCAWLRGYRERTENGERVPEPEWHAALSVYLRCEDGDTLCHDRSKGDARYSRYDTDAKIAHIREAHDKGIGPVTCARVRTLNPQACAGCRVGEPTGPIRSPISLGIRPDTARAKQDDAKEREKAAKAALKAAKTDDEKDAARAARDEAVADRKAAERAETVGQAVQAATASGGAARLFTRGDHAEIAEALVEDMDEPMPVYHLGELYRVGEGNVWEPLPLHRLASMVAEYAGTLVMGAKTPKPLKIDRKDQTGVAAMIADAIRSVTPDPLPVSEGIAFMDGLLLADGAFRAFETDDYVTRPRLVPVSYQQADGTPPPPPLRWLRFLHEIYAGEPDIVDRVAVLQEFLGGALFGVSPRYAKALMLLGDGANGKSVLLKVASALFHAGSREAIPPQRLEGQSSEYYRAKLLRCSINVVNELPESELMETSTLKAAVSGDEMTGRDPTQQPFRAAPRAAWIVSANGLPPVRDTSGGFWRRQIVLTHSNTFPAGKADPNLAEFLIEHELAGIARWAAEGGIRLLDRGCYTALTSSDTAVAAWRMENDHVMRFMHDHAVGDETVETSGARIYAAYRVWAQNNGLHTLASMRFFKRLPALGWKPRHTRSGNVYAVRIENVPGFSSARPANHPIAAEA